MLVSVPKNEVRLNTGEHRKSDALTSAPIKLAVLRNQTDAKQNNTEQTPDNHQRFSHLLSIMPAGVLVLDKKGVVSLANQQAINLLGEPIVGEAWRDVISRVFAPKEDDGHEVSMTNGKKVKIDISPLTEEKGQLIVITDLTETRELQSRVGHMQRLSSLGKMVASLAHQVRTPLSSALLYAENLKAMPLQNEMASRFSEKLTLRLRELESQVNDMLLFAKSSDQQIVSSLGARDIMEQSLAQTEAQLRQANVLVHNVNDSQAEPSLSCTHQKADMLQQTPHVLGNLTAITGAITNLISNAMQALEQQKNASNTDINNASGVDQAQIWLSQTIENSDQQEYCVFTVADNGKGLSSKDINHLFEPFYTTKSQGTGLGLAVVNTVAKSHKGFVKCGNNEHGGAYFSLYIPTHKPNKSELPTFASEALASQNISTGVPHE